MSGAAQGKVYTMAVSGSDMLVLLAYADNANDFGKQIYPSLDTIAWKVGLSRRQVQRIVKKYIDLGWLKVIGKTELGINRLEFDYEKCQYKPTNDEKNPAQKEDEGVTSRCHGGDDIAMSRGGGHPDVTQSVHEPSINSLGAIAQKTDGAIDLTPPIPTQNISRTDAMEQKDALTFMFERAMMAKAAPAETTIRKWNLPPQLTDLCLMFLQVTNQIVTPEDKGKWANGAKRLAALLPHGLNQAAMERAYSVMCKDKMTCTHPGAIYEKCKEAIQVAQPKADDDSANWVYTPSGQRVRAQ